MKILRLFVLFSLFFVLNIDSQSLDSDFLQSLPDGVRSDLMNEIANQPIQQEAIKFPKTDVSNLSADLNKIQTQLSQLESRINKEFSNNTISNLKPFGYEIFSTFQTTFMPINLPNMASNYILDTGDSIKFTTVSSKQKPWILSVERDGSVFIPSVGRLSVSGLPFVDVAKLINQAVKNALPKEEAIISLNEIRDMSILVIGGVNLPGMYTVPGLSNVVTVLTAAGGIDRRSGSLRNIVIKRNNTIIETVDLYDVLIDGNTASLKNLRDGDVIIVKPKYGEVSVSGGVNVPAIYELSDKNESLNELIKISGNLIYGSDEIEIFRRAESKVIQLGLDQFLKETITLFPGDDIRVKKYIPYADPIRTVHITGEVNNPGIYTIDDGEKLSSLISRAGGYTVHAYEFAGTLFRESAKIIERQTNERLYKDMIKFLATSVNAQTMVSGSGGATLPIILEEFKDVQPTGRVTANFNLSTIKNNPDLDNVLQDGDVINIPPLSFEVFVLGEVLTPGARQYDASSSVSDYIKKSGDISEYGDRKRIIVISPNGDSSLYNRSLFSSFNNDNGIVPGSIIYIPREIGKLEGINYAAVVAPIFSSLALSLASLNSINN